MILGEKYYEKVNQYQKPLLKLKYWRIKEEKNYRYMGYTSTKCVNLI